MSGYLRIVRGDATPEEIAALVAVLAARRTAPGGARRAPGANVAKPRPADA
jgi:hypothetical protein